MFDVKWDNSLIYLDTILKLSQKAWGQSLYQIVKGQKKPKKTKKKHAISGIADGVNNFLILVDFVHHINRFDVIQM